VSSETALFNLSLIVSAEWDAHLFQRDNGIRSFTSQDFNHILVSEVIAALHRVEYVPFPMVFFFVSKAGGDSALSRD
jgi:hypothetical protein